MGGDKVVEMRPSAGQEMLAAAQLRDQVKARVVELARQIQTVRAKAEQAIAAGRKLELHAAALQGALEESERMLRTLLPDTPQLPVAPPPQETAPPAEG